jgi:ABC-type spermidine/putrescine transport system permease subunit I
MDFGFGAIIKLVFILLPFAILGIWKAIEVIIWIINHIHIY